jgi:(5-formylfuran-3-yl)methyl phosphate synthase
MDVEMRLMISVTSAAEAIDAIQGGADLLDVKNPAEGSLGAQSPQIIRDIVEASERRLETSAAIGDMPNLPGTAALAALGAASCGVDYVKVGLHGVARAKDARELLRQVVDAVRGFRTSVIAAGYADYQRIGSIDPWLLPELSAATGVQGALIDTAVKDGRRLFDFMKIESIRTLSKKAHEADLLFACAGSLREQDLPPLRDGGADIVGLRTAVCQNHQRSAPLSSSLLRDLINRIR